MWHQAGFDDWQKYNGPRSLLVGSNLLTHAMEQTFYARCGKRVFDSVAALFGLLLLFPLMVVLALLVKLSSAGPIFYRQERVGQGGMVFRIAKFRSMFEDADRRGSTITSARDPRVTGVGRILRRFKLDELPQLWNVLKGEMSLVGPRPEVPEYVETYSGVQRRVLLVRPGITGPASIAYREEEELLGTQTDADRYYRDVVLPDKLSMNLEYLDRISFSYDLLLMLRTTSSILIPKWTLRTQ
jgi:lipopolysaccharide/colanic/teichoic acid biosynthesis glycosyltransferase